MLFVSLAVTSALTHGGGGSSSVAALTSRRGALLLGASVLVGGPSCRPAVAADSGFNELRARLEAPSVSQLGDSIMREEPVLPAWLAGRWRAEQTLERFSTPLGVQFIGAPGRPLSEAEASAADTRRQIGRPVTLELRFKAVPGGAVEDREFNARSRLDAFAGRAVVRSSQQCSAAGVDSGPGLACTLVDFLGPVQQKQLVTSMRVAANPTGGGSFISTYSDRAIFARKLVAGDTRNFPPITTDSEVVVTLAPDDTAAGVARGKLRLLSFLQPYDPLYFAAGRKSVSISDYSLTLTRLSE
jgi:hypothetical protein